MYSFETSYSCDCGCLAVWCGGSIILFNNGYGDGCHKFYVGSRADFESFTEAKGIKPKFLTACIFKDALVLNYDCPVVYEDGSVADPYKTSVVLNGRYGIYCHEGSVFFEKWKD